MTLSRRTVVALAPLALALAAAPAALGQTAHVDMYYNPSPVLGSTQNVDLTFPQAFGTTATVTVFYAYGQAPCTTPSQACEALYRSVPLGQVSNYTYTADSARTVSFFIRADRQGQMAYSDMGTVTISASNLPLPTTANPIMFVTQVPIPSDFANVASTFGSHQGNASSAPRGGDLYIRYANGKLKNLTKAAGYGGYSGLQLANAVAVRDPAIHWSGTKAIFSMVVGGPTLGNEQVYYWQLYEITGFGQGQSPTITRVPNQPPDFNNVSPCYGSDNRIIFTSDRPRNGQRHLYPQLDEYEATPTNTGLWSLNAQTGELFLLQHSPSGSFKPTVDSYGRIVFTRWDHLQRDLQKDEDLINQHNGRPLNFRTFNYANESAGAAHGPNVEYFPEADDNWTYFVTNTPGYSGDMNGWTPGINGNTFNVFMPWTINQDGTGEETLNHIGRHELMSQVEPALLANAQNALTYHLIPNASQANRTPIGSIFQIRESPVLRGTYLGINAPEFFTHASGQIVSVTGRLVQNADQMVVTAVTENASGHYRSPLSTTDGLLLASHTAVTSLDADQDPPGPPLAPRSLYDFRLKTVKHVNPFWTADRTLTSGIRKSIQYNNPYQTVTFNGEMWELDPVEVVSRPAPQMVAVPLAAPEVNALSDAQMNATTLRNYLRTNNLALIVSRNLTTRDRNDKQQPFNLRVAGTTTQTIATPGTVFDISYLQLFQADQIRGGLGLPQGRRVLAVPMHAPLPTNLNPPPVSGQPAGSVVIANDGSMAALVPARRAMTWQMTNAAGNPVVRERYWVTFQPGEIRTCVSCHGANSADQLGRPAPTNKPRALTDLVLYLKAIGQLN